MRARILITSAVAGAAIAAIALSGGDRQADAGPHHLEVHEWGTFTSMQGPKGLWLEGLHHEEEALPAFVHTMSNTAESARTAPTKGGLTVERVTRKMETPVIYFYAGHPMRVKVDVSFTGGLINQWYPRATRQGYRSWRGERATIEGASQPIDVAKVDGSHIRWEIDVMPGSRAPAFPAVEPGDPWQLAREVKAAAVRTRGADREAERYLFYRGLGRESIPVHVRDAGAGRLLVDNQTGQRINAAFALEVAGASARFAEVGTIAAGKNARVSLAKLARRPTARVVAELRARVKKALVAEGLFADEAEAMVATWSRQWFRSEGTRLIYVVPRTEIDKMLPIRIEPKPRRMVRAFIGRVEVITEAMRAEVARALATGDRARLARLGRFEEPYMRLLATARDREVRALAVKRLAALNKPDSN